MITLAVADLERALAFYRGLGFESKGIIGTEWTDEATGANGAVAMFELDGGLLLNLYSRADLAKDAAIPVAEPQSGAFSLAQLVRSRAEVDALLEKAASAGAAVTAAHDRPWGGSTPATSVILMATSGRSSGIRTGPHRIAAGLPPPRKFDPLADRLGQRAGMSPERSAHDPDASDQTWRRYAIAPRTVTANARTVYLSARAALPVRWWLTTATITRAPSGKTVGSTELKR